MEAASRDEYLKQEVWFSKRPGNSVVILSTTDSQTKMSSQRRCPDCGVTMEKMKLRTAEGYDLQLVTDEPKQGILGGLGMKEKLPLRTVVCPECGLVRQYAEMAE